MYDIFVYHILTYGMNFIHYFIFSFFLYQVQNPSRFEKDDTILENRKTGNSRENK